MKIAGAISVIALVFVAAFWFMNVRVAKAPVDGGYVCTQDAKLCPDGSYVGRTGPDCQFAACPAGGAVSVRVRMNEEASGLGVRVVPLKILEDSRCPTDVVCIQAGTVRLRARLISGLGEAMQEFTLGQPITTEAEEVLLAEVSPAPKAGVPIADSAYEFTFQIGKR